MVGSPEVVVVVAASADVVLSPSSASVVVTSSSSSAAVAVVTSSGAVVVVKAAAAVVVVATANAEHLLHEPLNASDCLHWLHALHSPPTAQKAAPPHAASAFVKPAQSAVRSDGGDTDARE